MLFFIRAHFYVLLVFVGMCSVFWLFWLSFITCQVIGYKDFSQEAEPWRGDRLQKAQAEECMI